MLIVCLLMLPHDHHSILRIAICEETEKIVKKDTTPMDIVKNDVVGGGENVVESDYKIIHRMLKNVCERGSAMMSKLVGEGEPKVPLSLLEGVVGGT